MIKSIHILQNSYTTRLSSEEDNEVNRDGRGSTEKALAEREMVRKPLPEPGADSRLPQAVPLTWKGKEKKPFSQYQMF